MGSVANLCTPKNGEIMISATQVRAPCAAWPFLLYAPLCCAALSAECPPVLWGTPCCMDACPCCQGCGRLCCALAGGRCRGLGGGLFSTTRQHGLVSPSPLFCYHPPSSFFLNITHFPPAPPGLPDLRVPRHRQGHLLHARRDVPAHLLHERRAGFG